MPRIKQKDGSFSNSRAGAGGVEEPVSYYISFYQKSLERGVRDIGERANSGDFGSMKIIRKSALNPTLLLKTCRGHNYGRGLSGIQRTQGVCKGDPTCKGLVTSTDGSGRSCQEPRQEKTA